MYEIRGNTIRRVESSCLLWWLIPALLIVGLCIGANYLITAFNAHQQEALAQQKAQYHREVSAFEAKWSGNVRVEDVKSLGSTSKDVVVHKGGTLEFTIDEPTTGAGSYTLTLDTGYTSLLMKNYALNISVNGVSQGEVTVNYSAGPPYTTTHTITLKACVNKITVTNKSPDDCNEAAGGCTELAIGSISVDKVM